MCSLKALCDVTDPKKCPDLWGVFNYMPNRASGECGIQNGTREFSGPHTISTLDKFKQGSVGRKDMTEDGWLKSGDLTSIDPDGLY